MKTAKYRQIANDWCKAFNHKSLDDLLRLYDDNAQHYSPKLKISSPETNGLIKGKEELKNWWQGAFERLPSLSYRITSLTIDSNKIFMEYIRNVEGEIEMFVAEVLEIDDGLIVFSRVYHG